MRRTLTISFWVILSATIFQPLLPAEVHQDKTYGYRISPPADWIAPTRSARNQWIIGRFISKKPTFYNDPQGWTWEYKPEMTVVAFVHDVIERRGVKVKTDESEDGLETTTISISTPFKDYKDYLKRTYYNGGYYFDVEEETTLKGIPVTCYEVKVEKLTRTGPRRIFARVYHLEGLDIAVQIEILEKSYSKLRGNIQRCFKSFRVIKRSGELPGEATTEIVSRLAWKRLTPLERGKKRLDLETKAHAKALAELPKGWRRSKVGRILVLDSFNPNLSRDIAKQCEVLMGWLDKTFPFVGPEEYVRAPILKVFKTTDTDTFYFGFTGLFDNITIEYEHNPGWMFDLHFEGVNRRIFDLWFNDRDRDLHWAMPYWMDRGLDDLIGNARAKGKKLEFARDIYDRVHLKQAHSKGTLSTPRDLMLMGREAFAARRYKRDEAAALVRYLLIGPGSKKRKTKNVFSDYLKNLAQVTAEIEEEEEGKEADEKPTTEEEEDEYFKNKKNSWKEKEKYLLEETFSRTFAGWKETDWKAFKASYMRMIDD